MSEVRKNRKLELICKLNYIIGLKQVRKVKGAGKELHQI